MTNRPKGPLNFFGVSLATGLGLGLAPAMPGTFGTLLGLPICWAIEAWGMPGIDGHMWAMLAAAVVLFVVGVPICSCGERHFNKKDPGAVVWDEIAAMPLVYLATPFTLTSAVVGFLWFRVFDIIKPWPIKYFERFGGGFGIMIDDTIAGLMAALATWGTMQWL